MLVIGHRGAVHEALENSFSSFEKAVEARAQRIELDVQLSADGEVVIMHDLDLSRSCGLHRSIADMDRAQLKQVKLNNGEPIPFLDEVIERFLPRIELNIEIKGRSAALAEKTARLIKSSHLKDKVVVSSFASEPLEYFRKSGPDIRLACLIGDIPKWPNVSLSHPLVFMQRIGTNIIHPWTRLVDENFMDQAKSRNWLVYAYSSMRGEEEQDREGVWTTLHTLGVDGLCSNFPREFRQWVDRIKHDEAVS